MVRVTRQLSFRQYLALMRLMHRYGAADARRRYFAFLYVLPVLGVLMAPFATIMTFRTTTIGPHEFVGIFWRFLLFAAIYSVCYPFFFLWRTHRFYRQQELGREWIVELSEEGIRSILPGKSDAVAPWSFFRCFTETSDLIALLEPQKLRFVAIERARLIPAQYTELKSLLEAHLQRVG